MSDPIKFECPNCNATHSRGYVNGVDVFRCLRCGYMGYGHHPDPDIDRGVELESRQNKCHDLVALSDLAIDQKRDLLQALERERTLAR